MLTDDEIRRRAHERWLREPEGCLVERVTDDEGESDDDV